jgi:hypothetical protein
MKAGFARSCGQPDSGFLMDLSHQKGSSGLLAQKIHGYGLYESTIFDPL